MIDQKKIDKIFHSSTDLRVYSQKLEPCFEEVFEMSLNTSLAVGKLEVNPDSRQAYETIANHIEMIAKKLKFHMTDLKSRVYKLTFCSMETYSLSKDLQLFDSVLSHREILHSNREKIQTLNTSKNLAFEKLRVDSLNDVNEITKTIHKMTKLNEQIWLTIGQLRVQLSQSLPESNLESIVKKIDELGEQVEGYLGELSSKSMGIHKSLSEQNIYV